MTPKTYQEYCNMLKQQRGLGDTIAVITEATGIDKLVKTVERVTGRRCNCNARRAYLNKILPYR